MMDRINPSALVVSASDYRRTALANILGTEGWRVIHAGSAAAVSGCLSAKPGVILTDYCLPDGSWTAVLRHVRAHAAAAEVVVWSRLADEQMWSEVLLCGGYDVIPEPFDGVEVLRVAGSAWREAAEATAAGRT